MENTVRVQKLAQASKQFFSNPLGELTYFRTYSRWIPEEERRETWIETVNRYTNFMRHVLGKRLDESEYRAINMAILCQEVMPSMRLMWAAGPAAERSNMTAYNCSYVAPECTKDFADIIYILMCGTGVGFSVEHKTVDRLPVVQPFTSKNEGKWVIEDSKEGWADAFKAGLDQWFHGVDIDFDYSKLRPAGARLHTMGGRSSGPEPLRKLIDFTRELMRNAAGRKLKPIEVHDIICNIGDIVVMGGVRRSSLISLSDLHDMDMRTAKPHDFYDSTPWRAMANNSAVYLEKPEWIHFRDEWRQLEESGTGERGIFVRNHLHMPQRRQNFMEGKQFGVNPCGEILLPSRGLCNLTEVYCRPYDTPSSIKRKHRLATILGTFQSMLTHFPYIDSEWKTNAELERLLGVSLTGQWDCPAVRSPQLLRELRENCIAINKSYAERFGIRASAATTCVKPNGNGSQTFDCSSGMHARHAPYYLRRVRISATEPLFQMLREAGWPHHPENGYTESTAKTFVLDFPVKSPAASVFKNSLSAIEQLEYWKMFKTHYTEHNPSITVSVGETEWDSASQWIYENWDIVGGLSFLPRDNHKYNLAPYEEITENEYRQAVTELPKIDFSNILLYEKEDQTSGAKELACTGGICEL